MLNTYEPDDCCGRHISNALRKDELETAERWECPKCGTEWTPAIIGEARHWSPRVHTAFVRKA